MAHSGPPKALAYIKPATIDGSVIRCPSVHLLSRAMTLKNFLIAAFAMTAFLGAAVVAVSPLGGGIDFAMPFDVVNR